MMLRMSTEERALAVAKIAVKKGTATENQILLVEKAQAKAAKAAEVKAKARFEAAKAAEEWAKENAEQIARLENHRNYFSEMEVIQGSNTVKAGIRYYHKNADGTRTYAE